MTRRQYIEQIRRLIYGGQPTDDAEITVGLVNQWLNQAIGVAAKQNYKENAAIEGVGFTNNSFYTTFNSLSIAADGQFSWKITLPQLPLGIGAVDGVSMVVIKDNSSPQLSYPVVLMSENQRSIHRGMRLMPNKVLGYPEGNFVFIESTLILNVYTANVTMVSGGLSTNLDSTLIIPDDYIPVMTEYLKNQLMFERSVPVDVQQDGVDAIKTT